MAFLIKEWRICEGLKVLDLERMLEPGRCWRLLEAPKGPLEGPWRALEAPAGP